MTTAMPRVIAVCGAKRSGKDTVAAHIALTYGYTHAKFASPLKAIMRMLFDFTDAELETDLKDAVHPAWNSTPRKLMQFMGTEVMQFGLQGVLPHVGRGFWAQKLFRDLAAGGPAPERVVISDLRFPHERDAIAAFSGGDYVVVRVERRRPDGLVGSDDHASERAHEEIDAHVVLRNQGSVGDLTEEVDAWVASLADKR